jgi:nucleoside-diphosphate-sugar epimerase
MNVLLTGATGYIGSHIAKNLLQQNHVVYATCRESSVFNKCVEFKNDLIWLNIETDNWINALKNIELDLLIHSAWSGVSVSGRDNWDIQLENFYFTRTIIDLSVQLKINKVICLGSQAEYGDFRTKVTEEFIPNPTEAYGAIKLLALNYLKNRTLKNTVEWYWLRVFSIIGENENESWLLPQVMHKLSTEKEIELTEGRQCYDYLYMTDFINRLNQVINCKTNQSGVYNICSGRPVEIRQLLLLVAEKLNISSSLLKFGALTYRENQNMFMLGSPEKFEKVFGKITMTSLEDAVIKITDFYKSKSK